MPGVTPTKPGILGGSSRAYEVVDPGFGAGAGDGAIVLGLGGPARARRRKRVLQGWRALPPFAVRSVVVTTFHRIDWR